MQVLILVPRTGDITDLIRVDPRNNENDSYDQKLPDDGKLSARNYREVLPQRTQGLNATAAEKHQTDACMYMYVLCILYTCVHAHATYRSYLDNGLWIMEWPHAHFMLTCLDRQTWLTFVLQLNVDDGGGVLYYSSFLYFCWYRPPMYSHCC